MRALPPVTPRSQPKADRLSLSPAGAVILLPFEPTVVPAQLWPSLPLSLDPPRLPISNQLFQKISLSGPAMSCPAPYGISRFWVINCLQQLARTPGPSGSLVTLWEPITFSCIFMPFDPQAIKAASPALCPFPLLWCTSSPPWDRGK